MKHVKTAVDLELIQTYQEFVNESLEKFVLNREDIQEAIKNQDLKTLQVFIEKEFAKMSIMEWTEKTLCNRKGLGEILNQCATEGEYSERIARKVIAYIAIHKRASTETLFGFFKKSCTVDEFKDVLYGLIADGFIEEVVRKNGELTEMLVLPEWIGLTQEDSDYLELFQSVPPSIWKPKKIRINKRGKAVGGYQSIKSPIFSRHASGTTEVDMKWIDMQNRNRYTVSYYVWDNYLVNHPILPDTPIREDEDDSKWSQILAVFEKNKEAAYLKHFRKMLFIEMYRRFGVKEIFIMNFFDGRLRNYAKGWAITTQGQDLDKALLKFPKEELTPDGMKWLMISIANSHNEKWGDKHLALDKLLFEEAYEWTKKVIVPKTLLSHKKYLEFITEKAESAESPAVFWSQAEEFWHVMNDIRHGRKPKCSVITHFDATCSGYQFSAIFTNDVKTMEWTNVIPNKAGKRMDFYTEVTELMKRVGLKYEYDRDTWKEVYIPAGYGSILCVQRALASEDIPKFDKVMNTFLCWGLNKKCWGIWKKEWTSYEFLLPDGCLVYKQMMVAEEQEIEFRGRTLRIKVEVNKPYEKKSVELKANTIHAADGFAAREMARRMNFSQRKLAYIKWLKKHPEAWTRKEGESREFMQLLLNLGASFNLYSVRILEEVRADNIDLVPDEVLEKFFNELPKFQTQVSEIHDSFGVHPNYVAELIQQYRYILHDFYLSNYMTEVVYQLTGFYDLNFEHEKDPVIADKILKSVCPLR